MYTVIFFDAQRVKVRDEGLVRNKAINLTLGVLSDDTRDILGIWIENTEGAKFWMGFPYAGSLMNSQTLRLANSMNTLAMCFGRRWPRSLLYMAVYGLKALKTPLEASGSQVLKAQDV